MHSHCRHLIPWLILALATLLPGPGPAAPTEPPVTDKVESVLAKVVPHLQSELQASGFRLGSQMFIRIFKLPGELEVWLEKNGRFQLFKSYPVCSYSGYLGPKLHEGDWQSPEGFYSFTAEQMNPRSSYHLSFNIGYPNEYDQLLNRSGSNIMVHGSCSSMGCFAMSDYRIEEIYALAHAALAREQGSIGVHVFPFPLTTANLQKFGSSPWIDFWKNLKEGYDIFERTGLVPDIQVVRGRYVITGPARLAMGGPSG